MAGRDKMRRNCRGEALILTMVIGLSCAAAAADAPPPEPPAAATPPESPAPAPGPPTTIVLHQDEIQGLLGKPVRDGAGEDMGHIVNVIVDRTGQARAVVIDFGGFLGVGSRKIAVDWNALHFAPDGKRDVITLDLNKDQVKAAPEYKEGKAVVVLGASGASQPLPGDPLTPGQ
jgi:PRC-barrel domain